MSRKVMAGFMLAAIALVGWAHLEGVRKKEDLACQATLYQEATALERRQEFAAAILRFNWLCDGVMFKPDPGVEHPCAATARLSERFHASYTAVMDALNAYRSQRGEYPASLVPILGELAPSNREMAEKFHYCKRENLTDRVGRCTDGSFTSVSAEISIGTGQYGSHSFNLGARGKPSQRSGSRTCAFVGR